MTARRAIAGAVLVDLAVSALFVWDVFTPWLVRELGASRTTLAAIFSVGVALYTVGVLAGGWAADRTSSRALVRCGAVGVVVGLGWCGFATSWWALLVGFSLVMGVTTGAGYAVAVRVAVTATAARRGQTLTIVVSAYAAATVVLAPAVQILLTAYGRRVTFCALGLVLGLALLVASFLVPGTRPARPAVPSVSRFPRRAVGAWWLVFCLTTAPGLVAFAHAGALVGSPSLAGVAVALLSFGNLAGRVIAGPLLDRIGVVPTLRLSCVLLAACAVVLALGLAGWPTYLALVGLGTQYGSLAAVVPAGVADRVPASDFGFAYGVVFTGWGLGGFVAPVVAATVGLAPVFVAALFIAAGVWLAAGMKGPPRTR